jgi:hypothetical protein
LYQQLTQLTGQGLAGTFGMMYALTLQFICRSFHCYLLFGYTTQNALDVVDR